MSVSFTRLCAVGAAMLLGVAALSGCDNTPRCTPASLGESCFCADGAAGQRLCAADGTRYGECDCTTRDGGVSDAATDESPGDAAR